MCRVAVESKHKFDEPEAYLGEVVLGGARIHCGKSVVRSNLWDPATQIDKDAIPSYGQIIKDQAEDPELTVDAADALVERVYKEELY